MKFKVGDKVRILVNSPNFASLQEGDVQVIKSIDNDGLETTDGWALDFNYVELVTQRRGRPAKERKTLYIVRYEERDSGDPYKEFTTRKELNDWLKDVEKNNVILSSIKVFEVKREFKVRTAHKLVKVV